MMKRLKRCSSSSLPETIVDYEDILTEILVRVPARILLRFKCVSKHWLSFISDPKFCHLHTLRNPKPSTSAVLSNLSRDIGLIPINLDHGRTTSKGSGTPSCNPLNFIPNQLCHDNIDIIQSCNGLFLCHPEIVLPPVIPKSDLARITAPRYHYVLNPTTNQFTKLVPPAAAAATTNNPRIMGCALAFDPSKSPHYKVVFLWCVDEPGPSGWCSHHHIEIYSSETKSWRLLNTSFETQGQICYQSGVYSNGAVHWVGIYNDMAYFHIEEERVGLVDGLPSCEENLFNRDETYFMESSDGHLHLIDIYLPCFTKFEVLEMGRDYSGWFVKYNVDLDPLCSVYPRIQFFVVLFLAKGEDEEECSTLLLNAPGKVFYYNLKSNTFKFTDLTLEAGIRISSGVGLRNHQYVETLACV